MPGNSIAFYSQQYASAVELVSQQMRPRIASTFMQDTAVGKAATVINLIDAFEADERTGLYEPMVAGDPGHKRPWVYPRHFDKALLFDTIEQMQMNANPTSEYVMGIVSALNRKQDDEAIRAFFAARSLETNGGGIATDNFAAGFQVGVSVGGAASGLNVEKIQAGLEILRSQEVGIEDDEQINCVISPKQERNLMNEIEVTSTDFTSKRIIDSGTMIGSNYMGINWILSNRLLVDGSSYRRIPFYTKRGMSSCTWNGGPKTRVSQRNDLRGEPWQAYGDGHYGSVRRDALRVIEIKCSEA
jgi:Phage capsid protein